MTYENSERQAAVIASFALDVVHEDASRQVSKVELLTSPLPERVGAMQATCSGPLSRSSRPSGEIPSTTPSSPKEPAAAHSSSLAQRAERAWWRLALCAPATPHRHEHDDTHDGTCRG